MKLYDVTYPNGHIERDIPLESTTPKDGATAVCSNDGVGRGFDRARCEYQGKVAGYQWVEDKPE